jgi:hypothetical protein
MQRQALRHQFWIGRKLCQLLVNQRKTVSGSSISEKVARALKGLE